MPFRVLAVCLGRTVETIFVDCALVEVRVWQMLPRRLRRLTSAHLFFPLRHERIENASGRVDVEIGLLSHNRLRALNSKE